MPTDLVALLARKKQARVLAQKNAGLMFAWYGLCLLVVALLFTSDSFAKAMALVGGIAY